jgi:integrase
VPRKTTAPLTVKQVAEFIRDGGQPHPDPEKRKKGVLQTKISDGNSLYLICRNGGGWWSYQYRDREGKLHTAGLGSAATVSLAQARAKRQAEAVRNNNARQAHRAARLSGIPVPAAVVVSPREEALQARAATFGTTWATFLDNKAAQWSENEATKVRRLFERFATPLDSLPVTAITKELVAEVLRQKDEKGRTLWKGPGVSRGSRLRGLIEQVLSAAGVEPNVAEWKRLRHLLSTKPEHGDHLASMDYAKVPAFLAGLPDTETGRLIRFATLTSLRKNEARLLRWEEINLDAKVMIIVKDRMKKRREFKVPLSDAALACLGPKGTTGRVFKAHNNAAFLIMQHVPDATLHGFRTSMGVWAQEHGYSSDVIELALSHVEKNKTKAAYQRGDLLEARRKLADEWAAFATAA